MDKTLKQLIREGEGNELDFKKTITSLDKIAKTLVSFANHKGGTILVGVRDDRQIVGINPEEEIYMLTEASTHYCDPPILLIFDELEEEEGTVLVVTVPESDVKPHKARDNQGGWQVYIRNEDKSMLASQAALHKMEADALKKQASKPKQYTKNQLSLIHYIRDKGKITLKETAKLVNVSKRRADRILMELIQDGQILLHYRQKSDIYKLKRE